jgi:hypothetical protein
MKRRVGIVAALAVGAIFAAGVQANDSIAEMAAGGLVLKQSRDIDMLSEDLYVSARQIRVRYVFRNRSPRDVRTIVAFPMPDRNLGELQESNRAFPAGFRTVVDGRPVRTQVERRAMLRGTDHSALLRRLNIPISTDGNASATIMTHLDGLAPAQRQQLLRLGLIEATEFDQGRGMERHYLPRWTAAETHYWQQTFPAGRDLRVEHSYVPGTGMSASTGLHHREFRNSAEGRRMIADYCIDREFLAAVDRFATRSGPAEQAVLGEQRIGYILRTGANWRSPIGDFRLVVDKGAPENIVSFCGTGLRRISPTQFEMRRTNWRPTQDLRVLIVQPR